MIVTVLFGIAVVVAFTAMYVWAVHSSPNAHLSVYWNPLDHGLSLVNLR